MSTLNSVEAGVGLMIANKLPMDAMAEIIVWLSTIS
jgi:hypothetical protein